MKSNVFYEVSFKNLELDDLITAIKSSPCLLVALDVTKKRATKSSPTRIICSGTVVSCIPEYVMNVLRLSHSVTFRARALPREDTEVLRAFSLADTACRLGIKEILGHDN